MLVVPGYKEKVEFGVLVSFAYPVEGSGNYITSKNNGEVWVSNLYEVLTCELHCFFVIRENVLQAKTF